MSTRPSQPRGLMLCTFTPLLGLSETALYFLPGGRFPDQLEQIDRILAHMHASTVAAARAFGKRLASWMNESTKDRVT